MAATEFARVCDLHVRHHRRAEGGAARTRGRLQLDRAGHRAVRHRAGRPHRAGQFAGVRQLHRGDLAGAGERRHGGLARRRNRAFGAGPGRLAAARSGDGVLPTADAVARDGCAVAARRVASAAPVLRRRRSAAGGSRRAVGARAVARERLWPDRVHGHGGAWSGAPERAGDDRRAGAAASCVRAGRAVAAGGRRRARRTVSAWPWPCAWLSRPARADCAALPDLAGHRSRVPHRRPRHASGERRTAVPGPHRCAGEGAWPPTRTRGRRGGAGAVPRRA